MFAIDVNEIKSYEEILTAPGDYQVEILKAKAGKTQKGRAKIDLTFKYLDTIPAGEEIDDENFENPLDTNGFTTIYLPDEELDTKRGANFMKANLRDWLINFNVEPEDPNGLDAKDFIDCVGGIKIKHKKRDRNDDSSPVQAEVDRSVPLD